MKIARLKKFSASLASILVLTCALSFSSVQAADFAVQLAEQFLNKTPVAQVDPNMTMEQAVKIQAEFVSLLTKEFGDPVGYKAGLTNPNVQKAFGVSQPVRGTLLKKMLLESGAAMPAKFGSIPMMEGDLIVRVKDEGINQAKTPEETLKYLDVVIPFIELPDLVCDKSVKFNGAVIVAINVGARYGVMGKPIPLAAKPEWTERLKNFQLQMIDEKGTILDQGKGTALLGDPLNAVLWIKNSVVAEGNKLRKGDLLSLGSLTRGLPPRPGMTLKAVYTDLDPDGPVEVTVSFK